MAIRIVNIPPYPSASRAEIDAFLAAPRIMRVGVTETDGTPLVHPVWYTWEREQFVVHLGTPSAKRRAIEAQSTVYFTIDDTGSGGVFGVRGKAQAHLILEPARIREVVQSQCDAYAGTGDTSAHRFLLGMVDRGEMILIGLTPHYLAAWGLEADHPTAEHET
jgi:hypothetical protein